MSIFFTRFLSPYGMQRNVLWKSPGVSGHRFYRLLSHMDNESQNGSSGIFIGLGSSPLSWILLCALYINRKTSFLFSTIISFSKYSLRQHHPVIRKLAAADFFKLRQQICNLQILLLFS